MEHISHLHSANRALAQFQNGRYKTVGKVAQTRALLFIDIGSIEGLSVSFN